MIPRDHTFVLGARDPEMREIARVLIEERRPFVHAAKGRFAVNSRTAYEADGVVHLTPGGRSIGAVLVPDVQVVTIECALNAREAAVKVDHHNPGDAGYTMPPQRYLEGSSLGQLLRLLDREPTVTQRLLAAADHCLTAAYQGQCVDIDPDELLFLRASWRARVSGRSLGDVIEGILDAAKKVERHLDSERGESLFLDPLDIPPDLAEGAAYIGCPIRYREFFPWGALKEMLKGALPDHIGRFMDEHRAEGREVYGNPYRGYAGAYLM